MHLCMKLILKINSVCILNNFYIVIIVASIIFIISQLGDSYSQLKKSAKNYDRSVLTINTLVH